MDTYESKCFYPRLYQSQSTTGSSVITGKEDASYLMPEEYSDRLSFSCLNGGNLLALIVLEYMLRQITCLLKPITSELMTLK